MEEAPRQPRVLIVDNHAVFANVLRTTLGMQGFACGVAHTVAAAVEAIEFNSFDVLLTDYHLDDGLGIDVIAAVKERAPDIVTILMTGSIAPDKYETLREQMPNATIQKPFAVEALRALMERKLRERAR